MTATITTSGSSSDWKNTLLHRLIEQVRLWEAAENIDIHHVWESGGQYSGTYVPLSKTFQKPRTCNDNQIPMSYIIPDMLDVSMAYNIIIVDFWRALNYRSKYGLIAYRQDLGKFGVSAII